MRAALWLAVAALSAVTGCAVVERGDPRGVVVAHNIFTTLGQRNDVAQNYCRQFGSHAVLQATMDFQNSSYACIPDRPTVPPPAASGGFEPPVASPPGGVTGRPLAPL